MTTPTTTDLGPDRGPVPLAVWPCPAGQTVDRSAGRISGSLAAAIVTAFTTAGQRVLTGSPGERVCVREAARMARHVTAVEPSPAAAAATRGWLDRQLPDQHRRFATVHSHWPEPTTAGYRPDLVDLVLVVVDHRDQEELPLAVRLLTPGGRLVTVSRNRRRAGRLIDLVGPTVHTARRAGLLYRQHIVALTTGVRDGQLTPPTALDRSSRSTGTGGPPAHTVVHDDVLLFTAPTPPAPFADVRRPTPAQVGA